MASSGCGRNSDRGIKIAIKIKINGSSEKFGAAFFISRKKT